MTTIAARVAAGAAWMDEHVPGWVDHVDLASLDMADPCGCIRGQTLGYYNNDPWPEAGPVALGFNTDWRTPRHLRAIEYAELDAEWCRVIEARRGGDPS